MGDLDAKLFKRTEPMHRSVDLRDPSVRDSVDGGDDAERAEGEPCRRDSKGDACDDAGRGDGEHYGVIRREYLDFEVSGG